MKRKDVKKHGKNPRIRPKELEARGVHMDMATSWAAQELTAKYSDLDEMARFQQKQLQEKEQKLLQLYDQQQQRAYQVVQRGSAGSNGSSYGSSVSQHTVTKTSSNSHTTSTSQGGKVRQMFDERRQTTVKGIDRSYPLEPLENKPRKQANGNAGPRNGNAAISRQSVTLKRVVRADVNSNLNAGKPIVSYHEEIGRESFGSPGRQQLDDDEFGNENHVAQYANGNHRDEIEEVLDEDTIERNRMMAKLHLMEYDETLKHRIKNDLESEEFPEDFMVDVPDKLPKQSISKKLSQAEARLERFRNANAKRINNAARSTGPSHVPKKRADPILPGKAASRVAKSPSLLEATKPAEASGRSRRSVLSPQSKSPDMATRRPSTELKGSDVKSSKRTTPTKDAEPIGNRKTTATTARKSTDNVDGATVLENGLHLQDQTVETKHDNELHAAKKTFVVDDDEQPPKENNGPLPRKPLLKRPSIEKQTPSAPMQASSSTPKSKMTLKSKTPNVASSSSRSSASSKSGSNCTPDLLVPCKICGRSFAQERVGLHEQICTKTGQKKRKLFDSVMFRVKGTELEKFVKKGCAKKQQPEKPPETKTNWRRKHEDFINAIRSAKQVQAHLAAGGKLSDLPPPPPSDTSDYIQCPHCGRKFNKAAADRHIPKCEHMLHNKPVHSRAPKPRR